MFAGQVGSDSEDHPGRRLRRVVTTRGGQRTDTKNGERHRDEHERPILARERIIGGSQEHAKALVPTLHGAKHSRGDEMRVPASDPPELLARAVVVVLLQ